MMTLKIRILFIILLVIVLCVIIGMVRKRNLELKYVLLWLGCDIILIILMLFPQIIEWIARVLGIYSPMNAIIFLGFLFLLLIIFSLTVTLSHATDEIRRLTQIIAILPEENTGKAEEDTIDKAEDSGDDGPGGSAVPSRTRPVPPG